LNLLINNGDNLNDENLNSPEKNSNLNENNNHNGSNLLKNDKSILSNNKLMNNTEINHNQNNLTNNLNNDISVNQDINPKREENFYKKEKILSIRQQNHKSINKHPNKSSKNQNYLLSQDYIFTRCSYSSIRNYFFFSYFIRLYQFNMVKVVINFYFMGFIKTKNSTTIPDSQYVLVNIIFYLWVVIFPLIMLTYLRNHQNDLLSRKQIIKFGSFYLNYRGVSKDIYAFIMQIKFILLPYICINYSNVGDFIYYIYGIIFIYYMFFVSISQPFSKVWKVFNESLSYLILIFICFTILLFKKIDSDYKNKMFSYYTYTSLILLLLVLRSLRILIDTIKRVIEIKKMRMPKEIDYTQKKTNAQNVQLNRLMINLQELKEGIKKKKPVTLDKDEEKKRIKEFEYDEKAEYNIENMNDEKYDIEESYKDDNTKKETSIKNMTQVKNLKENANKIPKSPANDKMLENNIENINTLKLTTNNKPIIIQSSSIIESDSESDSESYISSNSDPNIISGSIKSSQIPNSENSDRSSNSVANLKNEKNENINENKK